MITQERAIAFVKAVRQKQDLVHGQDTHSIPEWVLIIRKQLRKAEDE